MLVDVLVSAMLHERLGRPSVPTTTIDFYRLYTILLGHQKRCLRAGPMRPYFYA